MTNYTELKRLAEAAKAAFSNSYEHTSNRVDFEMAASPDVVLSMIADIEQLNRELDLTQSAYEDVDKNNNTLRTQNRALLEALKEAEMSLRTIELQSGRDGYLNDMVNIRGYACSRGSVARAAIKLAEGKGV